MRIEGSMARTTATAFLIVAALYAGGSRAQSGWIDGGYWANGQFNISGWACDRGSSQPVMVMVVDPRNGAGLASAIGKQSQRAGGRSCLQCAVGHQPALQHTGRGGDGRGADRPSDPGPGLLESVQAMVPPRELGRHQLSRQCHPRLHRQCVRSRRPGRPLRMGLRAWRRAVDLGPRLCGRPRGQRSVS